MLKDIFSEVLSWVIVSVMVIALIFICVLGFFILWELLNFGFEVMTGGGFDGVVHWPFSQWKLPE